MFTGAVSSFLTVASIGASAFAAVAISRCPPPHSHVFRSDRTAVVYEGLNSEKLFEVLGCVRGGRNAYVLGRKLQSSEEGGGGVAKEVLAGPVVAYEKSRFSEALPPYRAGSSEAWVLVRSLRSGRILHKVQGSPVTLVVKPDGAVAWVNPTESSVSYAIHAVDRAGSRVLASGVGIDPYSLRLRGSVLSWVQNGKTAFAALH
jgi:hypothetical protein